MSRWQVRVSRREVSTQALARYGLNVIYTLMKRLHNPLVFLARNATVGNDLKRESLAEVGLY